MEERETQHPPDPDVEPKVSYGVVLACQDKTQRCLPNRLVLVEWANPGITLKHVSERVDCSKLTVDMHDTPVPKRVRVLFDDTKRSRERLSPFVGHQNEEDRI